MYDDLIAARLNGVTPRPSNLLVLPNVYNVKDLAAPPATDSYGNKVIEIGCFGAIRPLKNHLKQAIAAIDFAESIDRRLWFHINSSRPEQRGETVLKNLRQLFAGNPRHYLVEHDWLSHEDFLKLVARMDLGMQVSLTESFNIITADFIACGVPAVTSFDVDWLPSYMEADPNSLSDIRTRLGFAYRAGRLWTSLSSYYLSSYNKNAEKVWLRYLGI
jgi:hypothetical protein